jgi:uncharacterized protein
MNRRRFLAGSAAGAAAPRLVAAGDTEGLIDTHVYLSRWPFRRMSGDQTPALVAKLRKRGVTQAWAGSFDTVFHKDLSDANARLAADCEASSGLLVPFGGVNPLLPDWEEDLRRCQEQWHMPGIRIHPGYHNYTLQHPLFERLLRAAAGRGLLIQLAVWMEDERHQNPLMQIPAVDLAPLPALLEKVPSARMVILNAFPHSPGKEAVAKLAASGRVAFDFARLDGYAQLRDFAGQVGLEQIVFGSYMPMFYFSSATLKLREGGFSPAECAVLSVNARRLLGAVA